MRLNTVYMILLSIGVIGFVAWRIRAVETMHSPQYEIVEDPSGSHGPACQSLPGLVEHVLESPDATPGSTLTVLVLGDQSTANEPRRLGLYPIPTITRVAEGRNEIARRRGELLADIQNKCRSVRETTISPIYLGVKQAVVDLRAKGCHAGSRCRLYVDSDLEENVETSIMRSLHSRSGRATSLPPPIDNAGINIAFCGTAVVVNHIIGPSGRRVATVVPRSAGQEDRIRRVWRRLFAQPEAVTFEPYCPESNAL